MVNSSNLAVIPDAVQRLLRSGARANQIAILTAYKAELAVIQRMELAAGITVATVDASQGKEYPFVILDLVNPGGRDIHAGFLADTQCMCVALSRAQSGQLILGYETLGQSKHDASGFRKWAAIIQSHNNAKVFLTHDSHEQVDQVYQRLQIPGTLYEAVG